MHHDDTPSYSLRKAKNRRRQPTLSVERRYRPDPTRQVKALLCLLEGGTKGFTPAKDSGDLRRQEARGTTLESDQDARKTEQSL